MQTVSNITATVAPATVADTAPATAAPVAAKPVAKPVAKRGKAAAKPVAAKPVADNAAKLAAAAKLSATREANRATAATVYAGASLTAHKRDTGPRDIYAARVLSPVQSIGKSGPTTRDESGLHLLATNSKAGVFCPVALAFDIGALSRLASGGFVAFDKARDEFKLTATGAERARNVAKRVAKA